MASVAFPHLAKRAVLSDGTTYGYAAVPSAPGKPSFLLLHGYPSSSFDWRLQMEPLASAGYGIINPDLLGYGDSDKPTDLAAYRMKIMSGHMIEIMDRESVKTAIVVAHDWGVGLASRLASYYPARLCGFATIAVSYTPPGMMFDIDAMIEFTRSIHGRETMGYWKWHITDDAVTASDSNPASAFNLLYAHDPSLWLDHFAPLGKAEAFVSTGQITPLPTWYSLADYTTRDRIFAKAGYAGPLSWYKAAVRGVNIADEELVRDEEKILRMPCLFIAPEKDHVCVAETQIAYCKQLCPNARIERLDCGHWVQLEEPEKFHGLLLDFAEQIGSGD